jgi:hypothetical protein
MAVCVLTLQRLWLDGHTLWILSLRSATESGVRTSAYIDKMEWPEPVPFCGNRPGEEIFPSPPLVFGAALKRPRLFFGRGPEPFLQIRAKSAR